MNLQPRKETIVVQDEILLSTQGQVFKVGGITLDGTKFGADGSIVKAGTAVMLDVPTGLYKPYADATGAFPAGAIVAITAQDAVVRGQGNLVVGAYLKAYLNTSKLTGVTTAFKAEMKNSYIFG